MVHREVLPLFGCGMAVPRSIHGMLHPGPPDHILLGVPAGEVGHRLAVSVPQFFAVNRSANRAIDHPSKDEKAAEIEPDDRVGSIKVQATARLAVVAANNPTASRLGVVQGGFYRQSEIVGRGGSPVRAMEERVELDMGEPEPLGKRAGKGGLPRTRATNHRDAMS